ncbi:MAG: hypothetical protein CL600_02880 [Alteromonas sp.]|nr:hypothetical protein [Alteromonas sp.]
MSSGDKEKRKDITFPIGKITPCDKVVCEVVANFSKKHSIHIRLRILNTFSNMHPGHVLVQSASGGFVALLFVFILIRVFYLFR